MVDVCDRELFAQAHQVPGRVVLITGAGSGIGKGTAMHFARHGAKLVLGDINAADVMETANSINRTGGVAIWRECDVRTWDEQVELFQAGYESFGKIDVVVVNAGIRETGGFLDVIEDENGRPAKPIMDTLSVNLSGALFTTRLGVYYLSRGTAVSERAGRAIIHVGSMSPMVALPGGVVYTAAKSALIGLLPGLHASLRHQGIRTGVVCPWFVDTGIMTDAGREFIASAGMPYAPVPRVAGAIFCAASAVDDASDGCVWTVPDGGEVCRIPREQMTLSGGVYTVLNERLARASSKKKWSDTEIPATTDTNEAMGDLERSRTTH